MSSPRWDPSRKPRLPDGLRIYAVSDVHGCANLLQNVFAAIDHHLARAPPARAIHVFLGDYIDRGPASRETIDLLVERSLKHETIFLKGNHESFLLEVLQDPERLEAWKDYGGFQTLMSYGLIPSLKPDREERMHLVRSLREVMPHHHQQFFSGLRTCLTCGDFFFTHAGVRPGIPLRQQREEDLLWIREDFLQSNENFGKFIVHGHTPVAKPDIRPHRINIDTGAYATGILTLLLVEGDRISAI
jgi:serine/threonine protein phosphatase 1